MKTTKPKKFDTVLESRRWKAAVSRETQGMTREQILAYFDKDRVLAALRASLQANEPSSTIREEPAESNS
jgi:hypothetical protein